MKPFKSSATSIDLSVLQGLNLSPQGLGEHEVTSQLSKFGPNDIVGESKSPWVTLALDTIKDPMIWFLIGIGALFWVLGDRQEASVVFAATIPLLFMDAFLHWRTQATTASLKGQLASTTIVVRDGTTKRVGTHQIVPGDLVLLDHQEHFLPADGIWENAETLQVDESVLTGEAFPVSKVACPSDVYHGSKVRSLGAELLGYAGTRVLTGRGHLRVLATGRQTSYGEIVHAAVSVSQERTALQKAIDRLTQWLVAGAALFCLVLAAVRIYQGHGWLDALMSAATLAVAAIPEEFPVVFTFFLGVGVYRLAKKRAWVRRAVSVENIGRVDRICTDKTGTITWGLLELTHLERSNRCTDADLILLAAAAANPEGTDPVDLAILNVARNRNISPPIRFKTFPFTEDRKRESAFFVQDGQTRCALKGAPETILNLSNLSEAERQQWLDRVEVWARGGHKVLAVGFHESALETSRVSEEPKNQIEFAGLLAFEDPARPEVKDAVAFCKSSGIRLLMLTGDHPHTAAAIGRDIGLGEGEPIVISAEKEPEKFQATWLKDHPEYLQDADIVARCKPMQKLLIVETLKARGEVVAVTGDGVNDVPALKAASIGIAMGLRGSRSAKEVSSIVLGDDNFSTIVNAIREGRQLLANLRLAFEYLFLVHIPFVVSAALVPLLGYPILYMPSHVVWMEALLHPTALLAFQLSSEEKTAARPPREQSFFDRRDLLRILTLGFAATAVLLAFFILSAINDASTEKGRSLALAFMTLWSVALSTALTRGRSHVAHIINGTAILVALLLIQNSTFSNLLHFAPLTGMDALKLFSAHLPLTCCLWFLIQRKGSR